jgi:hypothetical protein
VVVLNSGATDRNAAAEIEPNDALAQAQTLTLAATQGTVSVSGSVETSGHGKGGDVDVFRLAIPNAAPTGDAGSPASRRLRLDLTPAAGLALALELTDEAGHTLEGVSGSAGEAIGMPNMAVTPAATYFARIKSVSTSRAPASADGGASSRGYQLSAALSDFEPSEEREPNDRAELAQELAWYNRNADVVGVAGWRRDEDWYALSAEGFEPGWTADLDVEGADGVSLSVTVYDSAGQRVAGVRGRKGERLTLKRVTVPVLPATGDSPKRWYVVVRADAGQNRTRPYILHVQAQLGGAAAVPEGSAETEPNDDPSRASPLAEGTITGFLPLGDVDFFTFVPDKPLSVTVEVSPPTQVTAKLEVTRTRDGQVLATGTSKGRRPARVDGVEGEPGQPLLIRLSQGKRDGNASQPYVLRLTSAARDTAGR